MSFSLFIYIVIRIIQSRPCPDWMDITGVDGRIYVQVMTILGRTDRKTDDVCRLVISAGNVLLGFRDGFIVDFYCPWLKNK